MSSQRSCFLSLLCRYCIVGSNACDIGGMIWKHDTKPYPDTTPVCMMCAPCMLLTHIYAQWNNLQCPSCTNVSGMEAGLDAAMSHTPDSQSGLTLALGAPGACSMTLLPW